jgi:hypothetical protein
MPTIQVQTPPVPQAEPATPALLNAALRLDLDVASADPAIVAQLELLKLYGAAARRLVELHTGRFVAAQTVRLIYTLSEAYELPEGATATAVSGFFGSLEALDNATTYLSEYRKGAGVNRDLPWSQAQLQTYTVIASISPTATDPLLVAAILELAGEMYKNRETTLAGYATSAELPVSWRVKLAHLVVHPLGY